MTDFLGSLLGVFAVCLLPAFAVLLFLRDEERGTR